MGPPDPERELSMYRGLLEVSHLINGAADSQGLLRAILEVAQRVLDADAGSLFLDDPGTGDLVLTLALAPDGIRLPEGRIAVPAGRGIVGWVAQHGEPELVADAYADPRFFRAADEKTGYRTRSILCAPLVHERSRFGVIQMLNPRGKPAFDALDLQVFTAYAQMVATAWSRLRSIEERERQALMEREVELAAEIQRDLLPASLPAVPGCRCDARYRPARTVGGDFYSALRIGAEVLWFVIGDVAGKGIPASLRMAQSVGILHAILDTTISPALVMERWNRALCAQGGTGFVTAILGRYGAGEDALELTLAGHPGPWHLPHAGAPHPLDLPGGPPIGLIPETRYPLARVPFVHGDRMLLLTDGFLESRGPGGASLEDTGLEALFGRASAAPDGALLDALLAAEATHRDGMTARDDLTLLLLEWTSAS